MRLLSPVLFLALAGPAAGAEAPVEPPAFPTVPLLGTPVPAYWQIVLTGATLALTITYGGVLWARYRNRHQDLPVFLVFMTLLATGLAGVWAYYHHGAYAGMVAAYHQQVPSSQATAGNAEPQE